MNRVDEEQRWHSDWRLLPLLKESPQLRQS